MLKKNTHLLFQIAIFFLVSVIVIGTFSFFIMRIEAGKSIQAQIEEHASSVAGEVGDSIKEYPAYIQLLNYWYENSSTLDIEYDADFKKNTQTHKKTKRWNASHPNFPIKYVSSADFLSFSENDKKLYAEITYSYLTSRLDQIKQNYGIDYLFVVLAQNDFSSQFFLLSAADKGAVRGTNYEEVYPLGTVVEVEGSQKSAMENAVLQKSHLADAGNYVDYYSNFEKIGDNPVLIGFTYNLSGLNAGIHAQTVRSSLLLEIVQLFLSVIFLGIIVLLVLRPLKKVQTNIRKFKENKKAKEILQSLQTIKSKNELGKLARDVGELSLEIENYLEKIQQITAEKQRIGTELEIAKSIQEASIPSIFPAFPEREEFDIYATMTPAKEVGGDFYDFFLVDDDHLAIVMADVSGKGVPAALFMMVSKILISERAMMGGTPAEILSFVNGRICQNNQADMFVTVWLGIYEISSGKIIAANAGHDDPAILKENGKFELLKQKHGLVIGAMEGMTWQNFEFQLEPFQKLFLYTDGLPEATNEKNEMFGTTRMLDALNKTKNKPPKQMLESIWQKTEAFSSNAPQFDDLTMLILQRNGGEFDESKY